MNRSTPRARRSAFTLIELLVVIAIIAILAAILFPVFAQAKAAAKKTQCVSNQKQLGLMITMYTNDNDDAMPMAFYGTSASGTPTSWVTFMQPYIKNKDVFRCPTESRATGATPGADFPNHYAYNFYVGGNGAGTPFTTYSQMVKPSETVLFTEGGSLPVAGKKPTEWAFQLHKTKLYTSYLLVDSTSSTLSFTGTPTYGGPLPRHTEQTTVLWGDTHANSKKIETYYVLPGGPASPLRPDGAIASYSPCLHPETSCSGNN